MNSAGTILNTFTRTSGEDAITLGRIDGSFFRKERLTESELNHHVHIVGASGFGKTVLISHIIEQRIAQGKGLLFLDLKGDLDTIEQFRSYAEKVGRTTHVQIFSLSHPELSTSYNLIGNGSATQIRDRIMQALVWSEEFYRNQSSSFLLKLLIGLCWLRDNRQENITLELVSTALSSPDVIEDICLRIPQTELQTRRCIEEIASASRTSDYWNSLQGLRTQLESLVLSDFKTLIGESQDGIDLFRAVNESNLVFIFLDTRRYGETAKVIGRLILQELKSVSSRIDSEIPKSKRKPYSIVIDEFADLAQEDFIAFLDRARSSRLSVVVAHQELSDLTRVSPEFAGRLMGNTATVYAFLQKRGESADLLSSMAGTSTVRKTTERSSKLLFFDIPTGEKSVREVEEFIIHPNVIKALPVGKCICIKKYPFARAHAVNVSPSRSN